MPKGKSAAEAAVAEVQDESVSFEFRGAQFTVPRSVFGSARLLLAVASGELHSMVWEALPDPLDKRRFLSLVKPGDSMADVATEFFEALNTAAGSGNS